MRLLKGMIGVIRFVALLVAIFAAIPARADERVITLSSTTSTQDSGLFGHILPIFTAASGITVHVVAVGTGQR
jgi:tungstate transport system substrate-binding protein